MLSVGVGVGVGVGVPVAVGVGVGVDIPVISIHCEVPTQVPNASTFIYFVPSGTPVIVLGNEETNTLSKPVITVPLVHVNPVHANNFTEVIPELNVPKLTNDEKLISFYIFLFYN
jgi:hypothetical protein